MCRENDDCPGTGTCGEDGLCYERVACEWHDDCDEGFYCAVDGLCYPDRCLSDEDCELDNHVCALDGFCRLPDETDPNACEEHADCPVGQFCDEGDLPRRRGCL